MFTVYAVVQQDIRTGANDPQIQLAEDGATALGDGFSAYSLVGQTKIDIAHSLAPFVIVLDDSGKVIASSGLLGGQVPLPPSGVLDFARNNADDRITWQPASTTRIAAVVRHYSGKTTGFIVTGRSLREIEVREGQLTLMIAAAWVGLLVLTLIAVAYSFVVDKKREELEALMGE